MRGSEVRRYSPGWTTAAECLIYAFVVVGYLEKIHDLYYLVMVLDAVLAVISFFFIVLWFFLEKEYCRNPVSSSLCVLTSVILVSSVAGGSDSARLMVASFALLESWAVAIAVIILEKRIGSIMRAVYVFIIAFTILYALFSLAMGMEMSETRYSGLSDQTNSLAVVSASSLIIALSLTGRRRGIIGTVTANIALVLASVLFTYTLKTTDSRTSYFALLTALAFFLVLSFLHPEDRVSLVLVTVLSVIGIVVVVLYLLSSSRSLSSLTLSSLTSGRTTIWSGTLSRMEAEEYLFGFGGNSSAMTALLEERGMEKELAGYLGEKHLMHNIYIQFLVEYGIVSALAFTSGTIFLFVSSFSSMKRKSEERWLILSSSSLILFFLVHSLAESAVYFIGGSEQVLFILSLSVVYLSYRERRSEK